MSFKNIYKVKLGKFMPTNSPIPNSLAIHRRRNQRTGGEGMAEHHKEETAIFSLRRMGDCAAVAAPSKVDITAKKISPSPGWSVSRRRRWLGN
jgi:hypothetical protein